jgi:hypothetical protein
VATSLVLSSGCSKEATYGALCPKNQSRLWLRRCHRRQLPHTGVSARLEPLAFPYQHEPRLEPDPKAYAAY